MKLRMRHPVGGTTSGVPTRPHGPLKGPSVVANLGFALAILAVAMTLPLAWIVFFARDWYPQGMEWLGATIFDGYLLALPIGAVSLVMLWLARGRIDRSRVPLPELASRVHAARLVVAVGAVLWFFSFVVAALMSSSNVGVGH